MTNDIKDEFSTQLLMMNDTRTRIDYVISVLKSRGQDEIARYLEPVSQNNLIVLNKTQVNIFAKCMANMGNSIVEKVSEEISDLNGRVSSRIGGMIDASIRDVIDQNEENHEKITNSLKEIPELIGLMMDEMASLKSKVNPLADRTIEELAELAWSKFGSNYVNRKVTKTMFYNIVEDIKKIL